MWPSCLSDRNSRSCLCREKSMAPADLKLMLAWVFFLSFFLSFFLFLSSGQEAKNYWVTFS